MFARLSALVIAGVAFAACSGSDRPPPAEGEPNGTPTTGPGSSTVPGVPTPRFGATVTLDDPPPALGAATLVVSQDGRTAIGSDSDRDRVVLVDTITHAVRTVGLAKGDEPGRIAEDNVGRVHVVLRRGGSVATIDLATASVVARRAVCAAPRGIAHREGGLYVACAGGELVGLGAEPTTTAGILAHLDRDLRDVVVTNQRIYVSRFKSAHILILRLNGSLLQRQAPPELNTERPQQLRAPGVAWRMVKAGELVRVVHQNARATRVPTEQPGAYATPDPCDGLTVSTTTQIGAEMHKPGPILADAVVPIDLAITQDESQYAVIAAGNAHVRELPQVHVSRPAHEGCMTQPSSEIIAANGARRANSDPPGEHVAAAFLPDNRLLVLSREPAALHIRSGEENAVKWTTIALGGVSKKDTGHAILHANSGGGIACASCHPEGGEDGVTWRLGDSAVRTQSLRETLDGTGPYHWRGDIPDLKTLAHGAFTQRMSGPKLGSDQVNALTGWMLRIPRIPASPPADEAARLHGRAIFESPATECSSCHAGSRLTDNRTVDVGTGGALQVPSLIGVAARAPYMHNGCAAGLLDGFGKACGSTIKHGTTSHLTPADLADLERYLESL